VSDARLATPRGLKARGRRLWATLVADRDLSGGHRTLAEEACRIADRLDVLDRILAGDVDTWLTVRVPRDDSGVLTLVVNGALAEARQQANTMRALVAGLPLKDGDDDPTADSFVAGLTA